MSNTSIEWVVSPDGSRGKTWNPARGCSMVSAGCTNCYAMKMAHRFSGNGQPYEGLTEMSKRGPRWNGTARFVPEMLDVPLRAKKSTTWFVNSMSDVFHEDLTFEQIAAVFGVMASCPQHTFQVLTKRPERAVEWFRWVSGRSGFSNPLQTCLMAALDYERETHRLGDAGPLHTKRCADPEGPWPLPNVWLGASTENQETADERIPILLTLPAAVRFVSAEPLLGPVDVSRWLGLDGVTWVIGGGESGQGARPCNLAWLKGLVVQCSEADVAIFIKQLGRAAFQDNAGGYRLTVLRDRKGGDMSEWPADLRVREMPKRLATTL